MNTVKAITRSVRISPMKIRLVARSIVGLNAQVALATLSFVPRKAAKELAKTLKSAIANAENNHNLSSANLVITEAHIDDAKVLKRFMPAARGSAHPIRKRSSHIRIVLSEPTAKVVKATKAEKKAANKAAKIEASKKETK